ncbi:hypothetical protein X759_32725 [Mesorhizobium sp. LSHC420B00]|nr:hypothetical protein X759_32725 [Mesorhizobium sp. LSHC420B00]
MVAGGLAPHQFRVPVDPTFEPLGRSGIVVLRSDAKLCHIGVHKITDRGIGRVRHQYLVSGIEDGEHCDCVCGLARWREKRPVTLLELSDLLLQCTRRRGAVEAVGIAVRPSLAASGVGCGIREYDRRSPMDGCTQSLEAVCFDFGGHNALGEIVHACSSCVGDSYSMTKPIPSNIKIGMCYSLRL